MSNELSRLPIVTDDVLTQQASPLRYNCWLLENNFAYLPSLPVEEAETLYTRLDTAERALIAPNRQTDEYKLGTASYEDELLVKEADRQLLLTSEHAATRIRRDQKGTRGVKADYGTGALGSVLQEDTHASFMMPLGRQTGDANSDVEHKLKRAMLPFLQAPDNQGHFSLHGMDPARIGDLSDERGYSIMLGVGDHPSSQTLNLVEAIMQRAKEYKLRVGVNQPVLRFEANSDETLKKPDGTPRTITFAAKSAGTTRTFAQNTSEALGKPLATVQFEIGAALRLLPEDHPNYPGRDAQRIGTYAGYLFMRDCAELITGVTAH